MPLAGGIRKLVVLQLLLIAVTSVVFFMIYGGFQAGSVWFGGGIATANVLLLEPKGWIRLESADLTAIPAQNDHYAELGEQIALIGYDAPSTGASGSTVPFTAYWQALRPPEANYQVFVHLLDNRGQVVAQSDALNPGDFPTKRWPTDRYVRDEHDVILPGDLPAGEYQWSIGLWSAGEGRRLPVVDSAGLVLGDSVYLPGQLTIE